MVLNTVYQCFLFVLSLDEEVLMKKLETINKSSTGLNENIAALVAVAFTWLSGILFFLIENDSDFVKFHAIQATIFFAGTSLVISLLGRVWLLGGIISGALGLLSFVVWVMLLYHTYKGNWFKLPLIGDLAKNLAKVKE